MTLNNSAQLYSTSLVNNLPAVSILAEEIQAFGQRSNWSDSLIMQINLVLEELIVNSINYGYADNRTGTIHIDIASYPQEIIINIKDDADAFNPFNSATPDTSLNVDDRSIGGLGLFFVKNYIDNYYYDYSANQNHVTLKKIL